MSRMDQNLPCGGNISSPSPGPDSETLCASARSSSPDADKEWQYDVLGSEIDWQGDTHYEVRWPEWSDTDGSRNTWENLRVTSTPLETSKYDAAQARERSRLASESPSIPVRTTLDYYNMPTFLHRHAFDEKLRKHANGTDSVTRQQERMRALGYEMNLHDNSFRPIPVANRQDPEPRRASDINEAGTPKVTARDSTRQQREMSRQAAGVDSPSRTQKPSSSVSMRDSGHAPSSGHSQKRQIHPETSSTPKKLRVASTNERSDTSESIMEERRQPASHLTPPKRIPSSSIRKESTLRSPHPAPASARSARMPPTVVHAHPSSNQGTFKTPPPIKKKSKHVYHFWDKEGLITPPHLQAKRKASGPHAEAPGAPPPSRKEPEKASSSKLTHDTASSEDELNSMDVDTDEEPTPNVAMHKRSKALSMSPVSHYKKKQKLQHYTSLSSPIPSSSKQTSLSNAKIQDQWNKAAQRAGVVLSQAPMRIVNELDDDLIVGPEFEYAESDYEYADVELPNCDFLVACDCPQTNTSSGGSGLRCLDASSCGCQADSALGDSRHRTFAYDDDGLFRFGVPTHVHVVECNKRCACEISCPNRTSQRPRSIPIEIFKTRKTGWGVRSPAPIPKGKVLGIHTGIIRTTSTWNCDDATYCFDIDTPGIHSVDSSTRGNWTRFLNHSCRPNLDSFLVVHDTPPFSEKSIPYIAFFALEDIDPLTELTLCYTPPDQQLPSGSCLKKKKKKILKGTDQCFCGTDVCRGYFGKVVP